VRLVLLVLLTAPAACAQVETAPQPPPPPVTRQEAAPDTTADGRTQAEVAVAATIAEPGVHVVHFWAPWCGNSRAEFEAGWYEVVEANPDVSFSIVTIWNDGRDSADRLARYGIAPADHVAVFAQPDRGPSADRDLRRRTFLGLPLSWTPTTWIFNRGGQLAYAFNYGEVSPDLLATAIEHARDEWMHD
jgi:thiol-disulfide isomerase/thioredoxin